MEAITSSTVKDADSRLGTYYRVKPLLEKYVPRPQNIMEERILITVLPRLSVPRLSVPRLSGPRLSGRFFGDFRKKCSFFFLVLKINILMCKTLRAWQMKGRRIVPCRSKHLVRDFKVPRIH